MDDDELIAATASGDDTALRELFARHAPWLAARLRLILPAAEVEAFGMLAAGAVAGRMPGGTLALLRNIGGMAGIGLLSSAILGGAFGWVGPMAFLLIIEGALAHRSVTPWVWPTRPPHDRGGAICACLIVAAGLVLITVHGPRESDRESGPAS